MGTVTKMTPEQALAKIETIACAASDWQKRSESGNVHNYLAEIIQITSTQRCMK